MRILVVNSFYYPDDIGGAEKSSRLIAETLSEFGHDVYVLCLKNSVCEDVNGIKVFRINPGKFNVKARLNNDPGFIVKLKNRFYETNNKCIVEEVNSIIDEIKPDIMHCNNLYGISGIVWKKE